MEYYVIMGGVFIVGCVVGWVCALLSIPDDDDPGYRGEE